MIRGCVIIAVIIFVIAALSQCGGHGSGSGNADMWANGWAEPTPEVMRALAAKGIRGCGEFYQKENNTSRGDYAVACSHMPDGRAAWTGYEIFAGTGEVMGPDLTAVYTQFGGPPRQLTKEDMK